MLYISNLKRIIKANKFTLKEIAESIGLTDSGFHLALKNDTLKVRDLQKIAEILDVDIREFFISDPDENWKIFSKQTGQGNINQQGIKNKMGADKTELLKQENAHLKEKIELQAQLIEALKMSK